MGLLTTDIDLRSLWARPFQRRLLVVWAVAVLADAATTLAAVILRVGEEANPLPAAFTSALASWGPVWSHVALVSVGSFLCVVIALSAAMAQGRVARVWTPAVFATALVKIAAAGVNAAVVFTAWKP